MLCLVAALVNESVHLSVDIQGNVAHPSFSYGWFPVAVYSVLWIYRTLSRLDLQQTWLDV